MQIISPLKIRNRRFIAFVFPFASFFNEPGDARLTATWSGPFHDRPLSLSVYPRPFLSTVGKISRLKCLALDNSATVAKEPFPHFRSHTGFSQRRPTDKIVYSGGIEPLRRLAAI